MKKKLVFLFLIIAISNSVTLAQGISFQDSLSWKDILHKAQLEHKYIFVDVGATWCVPCHVMERDVLSQQPVGDYFNTQFINVKVQADKTAADKPFVRSWYADAQAILKNYNVGAFPTYLFLTPEGVLVHQGVGEMSVADFLVTGKTAFDPKKNLAAQKAVFANHQMSLPQEQEFAMHLLVSGDYASALDVAKDYKAKVLDRADQEQLKEMGNLRFIMDFQNLIVPSDAYFNLFYHNALEMDQLMKSPGFSYRLTNSVIFNNLIRPQLYTATNEPASSKPDWNGFERRISQNYPAYKASDIILNERYLYYMRLKNWKEACQAGIDFVEKGNLDSLASRRYTINQVAYSTLFLHSDDKMQLKRASHWLKQLLQDKHDDYAMLDTYSCLLYKLGKIKAAINYENQAIEALKQSKETDSDYYLKIFNANIEQMKQNKPTW